MALFPPIEESAEAVRAALAPLRNDLSVAVHSCGNAFAVGAIIRVAHSFLVREVIIVGDAPYYPKASMGMEKYETLVHVADDEAFFAHVAGRPVWAVEKDAARRSLYGPGGFPRGVVFVFGSERAGLGPDSWRGRTTWSASRCTGSTIRSPWPWRPGWSWASGRASGMRGAGWSSGTSACDGRAARRMSTLQVYSGGYFVARVDDMGCS